MTMEAKLSEMRKGSLEGTDDGGFLRVVQQANAICGECPIWDHRNETLCWVDLERPAAYRFNPSTGRQSGNWPTDSRVGLIALGDGGRLVVATRDAGVCWLDPDTCDISRLAHPAQGRGPGFYNDGRVDRRGRLWTGWIADDRSNPGVVYRVHADGSFLPAIKDVFASNGLGWSPDDATMYFTDSKLGIVYRAPFDLERGEVGPRRELIRFGRDEGIPDGLAVDEAGYVWIALYQGWRIVRCSPDGRIDRDIRVPVLNPTSLAFGGANLDELYVTSAVRRHSSVELRAQPLAGAVFVGSVGIGGQREAVFRLHPAY